MAVRLPYSRQQIVEFYTATRSYEVLHDKLEVMRELQPEIYRAFPSVYAVVGKLAQPPQFDPV